MLNFAKAYVIRGAAANSGQKQLDTIYKNTKMTRLPASSG